MGGAQPLGINETKPSPTPEEAAATVLPLCRAGETKGTSSAGESESPRSQQRGWARAVGNGVGSAQSHSTKSRRANWPRPASGAEPWGWGLTPRSEQPCHHSPLAAADRVATLGWTVSHCREHRRRPLGAGLPGEAVDSDVCSAPQDGTGRRAGLASEVAGATGGLGPQANNGQVPFRKQNPMHNHLSERRANIPCGFFWNGSDFKILSLEPIKS